MLFKKEELKNLWPFYLGLFIDGLSKVIAPFVFIYFVNLNYTYFQISVITSTFSLSMLLFEIPTGTFADGFSRKYSVILGFLILAIAFALIPLTSNFYLILILYALGGIGTTFTSGAEESWVIDNLNKEGRIDLSQEYFIKSSSFFTLGSIFAPIIGSLIVKNYSIEIVWFFFAFGFFLNAIVLMLFAKEHFKPEKLKLSALLKKAYKNSKLGLVFSIRHKVVFFSIIAGLFMQLMFCASIGNQQFLVNLGMKESQLGYLYSIAAVVGMIGALLSRVFVKIKPKNLISIVILIVMILLLSLSLLKPPFFIIACIIFILKEGLLRLGAPIYQTYLHKFIPGKIRASILSVNSMLSQVVVIMSSLVAGIFLDLFGPQKVIAFVSLFGVFAIFFYQKIKD